MVMNYDEEKKK